MDIISLKQIPAQEVIHMPLIEGADVVSRRGRAISTGPSAAQVQLSVRAHTAARGMLISPVQTRLAGITTPVSKQVVYLKMNFTYFFVSPSGNVSDICSVSIPERRLLLQGWE